MDVNSLSGLLKDGRPDTAALCLQEEGDAPEDDEPAPVHHPNAGYQPQPEGHDRQHC